MMEMLRKAELMCQKRKRQLMNRQIAELEQQLANFANNSIDSMTVEDYNALREKLRLLPKVSFLSPISNIAPSFIVSRLTMTLLNTRQNQEGVDDLDHLQPS